MLLLSYNVSSKLIELLDRIETIRREILLTPISPENELRLKWDFTVNRIYWSLALTKSSITRQDVIKILTNAGRGKVMRDDYNVLAYRNALSLIGYEWLASTDPVTGEDVEEVHRLLFSPLGRKLKKFRAREAQESVEHFLSYLEKGNDHPVVQAGVAMAQILRIKPFEEGNGRISRLLALLFLYKHGYDFRGFLCLEEHFKKDLVSFSQAYESAAVSRSLTYWLEYFASSFLLQAEKSFETVRQLSFIKSVHSAYFALNDRQKGIMEYLEQPGVSITNRKVRGMFRISQITASRDLAKLASLGLLITSGKGRSVSYIRL